MISPFTWAATGVLLLAVKNIMGFSTDRVTLSSSKKSGNPDIVTGPIVMSISGSTLPTILFILMICFLVCLSCRVISTFNVTEAGPSPTRISPVLIVTLPVKEIFPSIRILPPSNLTPSCLQSIPSIGTMTDSPSILLAFSFSSCKSP